jgi:hypothetical protein
MKNLSYLKGREIGKHRGYVGGRHHHDDLDVHRRYERAVIIINTITIIITIIDYF